MDELFNVQDNRRTAVPLNIFFLDLSKAFDSTSDDGPTEAGLKLSSQQ